MKNTKKKLAGALIAVAAAACLTVTGCGKGINADYCAIYDSQTDSAALEALASEETFMPADIMDSLTDGSMRLDVTLYLESTGDYTFTFNYYDPNVTDESAADYFNYQIGFIGTYTMEDDVITMGPAETGDITYTAGTDYTSNADYACFSYDGSGESGFWDYTDYAEILDIFLGGTATVSDETVVSWTVNE